MDLRVVALASTLLASGAHADQINWTGGSGVFQDASNWFPAEVPDANDLVVLDQDTDGTTITFAADVETLSLEMDRGTFTFELGGHIYLLNDGIAPLNFVGPAPYDLIVRNGTIAAERADLFASGQWRIAPGATVELDSALAVWVGASVHLTGGLLVIGDGPPPGITSGLVVNLPGESLRLNGGSLDVGDDAYLAGGSVISLDVNDAIDVGEALFIGGFDDGSAGTAELSVEGGTFNAGGCLVVWEGGHFVSLTSQASVGGLEIDGGAVDLLGGAAILVGTNEMLPSGGLAVNGPGPASAFVRGELELVGGTLLIADGMDGQGEVTVTGAGSEVFSSAVRVGSADNISAHALLTVADGAYVAGNDGIDVYANGELRLDDGEVGTEGLSITADGVLAGSGVISGSVFADGTVRPGSSIGMLRLPLCGSSFNLSDTAVLEIELAGFDAGAFDRIEVEGPITVDGALYLTPIDGFEPQEGQGFEIIAITDGGGQGLTGTFDTVEPAGWDALYLDDRVVVTFTDPCPADLDDTGAVGFNDLALLLGSWGPCAADCPWDLDDTNAVGFNDLAILLGSWGACP